MTTWKQATGMEFANTLTQYPSAFTTHMTGNYRGQYAQVTYYVKRGKSGQQDIARMEIHNVYGVRYWIPEEKTSE
jgi:hypothetical protein